MQLLRGERSKQSSIPPESLLSTVRLLVNKHTYRYDHERRWRLRWQGAKVLHQFLPLSEIHTCDPNPSC